MLHRIMATSSVVADVLLIAVASLTPPTVHVFAALPGWGPAACAPGDRLVQHYLQCSHLQQTLQAQPQPSGNAMTMTT